MTIRSYGPILKNLAKQISFIFLLYALCRWIFYVVNRSYFADIPTSELFSLFIYGLRFDFFSISALNALYILMCILPFKFQYAKGYQRSTSIIFIVLNAFGLLLNFIDFAFYPYIQKRMTYDVVNFAFGGQSDILKLIPHFFMEFWYLVILFIAVIWLMAKVHYRIRRKDLPIEVKPTWKLSLGYFLIFAIITGTTLIGIRGGLQRIPIVFLDAALYTSPKYIPVLINTPFSVLKSAELTEIKAMTFFDERRLKKLYSPVHEADTGTFKNYNVCVIALESFSKEFTGISNRKSYTPFLDSLMKQSVTFTNAIANEKTSINGIPAILASAPCFLDNHYLNSAYSNNIIQTLPSLLKDKGYYSVFYHGGTNGTMNFDSFAKLAGYDAYFGRTEYNDEKDYDGQWGIWDEPFLKRTVQEMTKLKAPFMTSIFTLSSHNPYKIPAQYEGKFDKGKMEIHQCIGYTDYALKQFFAEAQKQPWFENTVFVLCPDHTSISDDPFYANSIGQYSIPIIFYKKGISPHMETKTVQQLDIMPTVLNYLNYDQPYYSFGNDMFSPQKQPCVFYNSPSYYCVDDSLFYILSNYAFTEVYNYHRDSLLQKNLINTHNNKTLQDFCKAFIQTYNNDVLNNKTYYSKDN
jgi:phosphoglycerol transferase MdoB-like AlkP superfamily enzyme